MIITLATWIVMGAMAALGGILMKVGWKKATKNEAELQALVNRVDYLDPNVPNPPSSQA